MLAHAYTSAKVYTELRLLQLEGIVVAILFFPVEILASDIEANLRTRSVSNHDPATLAVMGDR